MKVIICEYHPWDTVFRIGNHHYARAFMDDGWKVLWMSHPVSPFHGMKAENEKRMMRARMGAVLHEDGPTEVVPYTKLPFLNKPLLRSEWVLRNSHRYLRPSLKDLLSKNEFDNPDLVWLTDTVMHSVADEVKAGKLAVRIADDNTEFKNTTGSLRVIEDELCTKADVVFVTSYPLLEKLQAKYGDRIHLLRNGVNYEHFQGNFERPPEYDEIDGPIAVYVGAIEEWFDPEIVLGLAVESPDLTIILIGPVGIDQAVFAGKKNIKAIGPRPYEKIPSYLAHADIGIIPFKRTPLVESVSPLKLFEFFAAGLPVVSTSWKELENLQSPAFLAGDRDEFAAHVINAVNGELKNQRGSEYYRSYAKENSWNARYRSAMDILGFPDAVESS